MSIAAQGLCAACRHRREIRNDRDSSFVFCLRSRTDAFFERYPRLPVWSCAGFEPVPEHVGQEPEEDR